MPKLEYKSRVPSKGAAKGYPTITVICGGRKVFEYTALAPIPVTQAKELCMERMALALDYRQVRRYILCADETVLSLFYANGWGYDIIDAGRSYPSITMFSWETTYKEACESMAQHAVQSYGGILNEIANEPTFSNRKPE